MNGSGRYFIARHGETVFNAAGRLQGAHAHTPLTRAGFAQADAMGVTLRDYLGLRPALTLWASDTGRALQTLAVITEHLDLDWHAARTDTRLAEIGMGDWGGRYYHDVMKDVGPILDMHTGLFSQRAPGGEWYDDIAARLQDWLDDTSGEPGDRLILMHGISSRVLRGMLTGGTTRPDHRAPVAEGLPQGSMVMIENGRETVIRSGTGHAPV
ncbi:histidine phosphatase family protein [Sphingomonas cavernae]|uniref:Phosphoglycerate mutase family protein n=1 Tax=Sphingomonas cavernae TaxID=2320861 RepID=A0A418WR90_9SPHN|nr:phosphoglycerate mutase family protein [Sphingomonas cavernae]RJF93679.1 phosphoglycerate mutase family protein [Sphingomonas cavernae]